MKVKNNINGFLNFSPLHWLLAWFFLKEKIFYGRNDHRCRMTILIFWTKIYIIKSIDKELFLLINGHSILRALRPFNAAVLRCGPQVNCLSRRKPCFLIIGFQWGKADPILLVEPRYFLFLLNKIASVLSSFGKSFQFGENV